MSIKNTYITIRKELLIFGVLFIVALFINLWAHTNEHESWTIIFKEFHIALAISIVLYLAIGMIRLAFRFFKGTVNSYQNYDKPEDF